MVVVMMGIVLIAQQVLRRRSWLLGFSNMRHLCAVALRGCTITAYIWYSRRRNAFKGCFGYVMAYADFFIHAFLRSQFFWVPFGAIKTARVPRSLGLISEAFTNGWTGWMRGSTSNMDITLEKHTGIIHTSINVTDVLLLLTIGRKVSTDWWQEMTEHILELEKVQIMLLIINTVVYAGINTIINGVNSVLLEQSRPELCFLAPASISTWNYEMAKWLSHRPEGYVCSVAVQW